MKHSLFRFALGIAVAMALLSTAGQAQSSKWEMEVNSDIMNPILSPNGKYLVYGHKKNRTAECVDAATGKSLWSNKLIDFKKYEIFRFVNDDVVLLGQENRYEFVNTRDGKVLKTLNIVGKNDWNDLVWETKPPETEGYEMMQPYHRANIGIYYFDDGFQILDLEKQEILMETKDNFSALQYKHWENVMMIFPRHGSDSIYFIDFEKRKLIFRGSTDNHDINGSLYQPFAMNDTELILFNDDNIQSIDLGTGKVTATMAIDTDDPDYFLTANLSDGLHLLVSEDDVQQFYRTKDGTKLWETPKKKVPGIVDQIIEVKDEGLLLLTYKDKQATVYKVNAKSGDIVWSRPLFKQHREMETGHKEGSKVGALLKTMALNRALDIVKGPVGRTGVRYDFRTGLVSYSYLPRSYSSYNYLPNSQGYLSIPDNDPDKNIIRVRERQRLLNSAYASFLSREKKTDAYMDLLTQNDNEAIFVVAGRAYNPETTKWEAPDQEGVHVINLSDGTIANSSKAPLLADKGGDLNAYSDLKIVQLPVAGASALVGLTDLYIQRDGEVEHVPFGKKKIQFLSSTDSTVTFTANDDDEKYEYWTLDAKQSPPKLTLLALSDEPNVVFPADTSVFTRTIEFNDYTITGHPLTLAKPGEMPTLSGTEWTIKEDDLDNMKVGRLTENSGEADSIQGIYSTSLGFFLMGDDGVAFVSPDGTCKWAHEWDVDREEVRMKPTILKDHLVVAMGGELMIVKNDCAGTVIAKHEIGFGDSQILTSEQGTVVILDVDDGKIFGYSL